MRALVVEDDPMIGRAVVAGLHEQGYAVDWVRDGHEAELALAHAVYDVALLDLGLPRRDGLEVLKGVRRAKNDLPVLIITARDSVADRIAGLDSGADDYLVKPFDLDELLARTRAVIRRHGGRGQSEVVYGALSVDPVQRRVLFHGAEVELSPREFAVLEALMKEPGAVVSRERLEDAVYGWGEEIGSNSIEVHVHHLRRKLAADLIRNVRGVGYRIARLQ
jgi:two-component system response regulator QseB